MKRIKLKPTSYSKAKNINDIIFYLGKYPSQDTGTEKSFEYSIEFHNLSFSGFSNPGVGTLSEHSVDNYDEYILQMDDGDVVVHKQGENFIVCKNEYILCAAIHFPDDGKEHVHQPKNIKSGYVVCGRRHHNCYQVNYIAKLSHLDSIQGFITNLDRFVDREEAFIIAKKANQIMDESKTRGKILYSEDLY